MKQENIKRASRAAQNEEDFWVDVHDDALMVELGIRQPNVEPRDEGVWRKTSQEKKTLKILRRVCKLDDPHFHYSPQKSIPVRAKLIVYLKKNGKYPHTTYSTICWQHEIGQILMQYHQKNRKTGYEENVVSKYVYNGKTYSPEERPFWYGK